MESRRKEQLARSKDVEAEMILGNLREEMGELLRSANSLKKNSAKQKAYVLNHLMLLCVEQAKRK